LDHSSGHRKQLEGQLDLARNMRADCLLFFIRERQLVGLQSVPYAFVAGRPGPKGGVDTPPGLSTAILGDSFEDLSEKRAGVDMWTIFSLLIIKGKGVHISGGGARRGNRRGLSSPVAHLRLLDP
jgi:hypothetical protein